MRPSRRVSVLEGCYSLSKCFVGTGVFKASVGCGCGFWQFGASGFGVRLYSAFRLEHLSSSGCRGAPERETGKPASNAYGFVSMKHVP